MQTAETFAVIGGDLRCAYLAGLLAADGYKVITTGFDSTDLPPCVTGCTNAAQALALADCVVLPMPVSTDPGYINAPFSRLRIPMETVLSGVHKGQVVVGGAMPTELIEELNSRSIAAYDYLQREELAVRNAVPTAEGAIQLAMEELPITLAGARCLITGYGRIGRVLSRLLCALGAQVTVAARRCSDLAWAQTQGCHTIELRRLDRAGHFDVIFNTVPVMLFDRARLEQLDDDTLLIDLASRPGGVDFNAAADCCIKTIWALSLPGRVAPKTAGAIVRDTILNILKEVV